MKPLAGLLFIAGLVITMFGVLDAEAAEAGFGLVVILISCIGMIPRR